MMVSTHRDSNSGFRLLQYFLCVVPQIRGLQMCQHVVSVESSSLLQLLLAVKNTSTRTEPIHVLPLWKLREWVAFP